MSFKQQLETLFENVDNRDEEAWIIDAKTGEILQHSDKGQSVKDNWVSNVVVDLVKVLEKDVILVHTHPEESSFSDNDWVMFGMWSHIKKMQVITPSKKVYTLVKPLNYDWKKITKKNIIEYWNKIEDDIFEQRSKNMSIEQIVEEINQKMAEQFNIEYLNDIPSFIKQ